MKEKDKSQYSKTRFLGFFGETKVDIKVTKILDFHSQKKKPDIHIIHYTSYNINIGKYYVHCNGREKKTYRSTLGILPSRTPKGVITLSAAASGSSLKTMYHCSHCTFL